MVLRSTGRYDDLDVVMSNEATRALRRVSSRVDGDARVEGVHRVYTDQDHTRRYRITPVSTGSWRSYPLRVKSGVPEAFKTQKSEPTSQLCQAMNREASSVVTAFKPVSSNPQRLTRTSNEP